MRKGEISLQLLHAPWLWHSHWLLIDGPLDGWVTWLFRISQKKTIINIINTKWPRINLKYLVYLKSVSNGEVEFFCAYCWAHSLPDIWKTAVLSTDKSKFLIFLLFFPLRKFCLPFLLLLFLDRPTILLHCKILIWRVLISEINRSPSMNAKPFSIER